MQTPTNIPPAEISKVPPSLPPKESTLAFMERIALSSISSIRKAERLAASLNSQIDSASEARKQWVEGI